MSNYNEEIENVTIFECHFMGVKFISKNMYTLEVTIFKPDEPNLDTQCKNIYSYFFIWCSNTPTVFFSPSSICKGQVSM